MITLSLDFPNEKLMPDDFNDFSCLLNSYEFIHWFKIIWSKIIPLTDYKDNIWESNLIYSYSNTEDMFEKLNDWNIKEAFYVVKKDNIFRFYIDKEINAWFIDIKKEINIVSWKVNKILNFIFGEVIDDPYMNQIVKKYLEETLWFKDMIESILKIINKGDNIVVKYNRYFEKKWWDPEADDYYNYGWAMNTYIEKIKKWDLI